MNAREYLESKGIDCEDMVAYSAPNGTEPPIDIDILDVMEEYNQLSFDKSTRDRETTKVFWKWLVSEAKIEVIGWDAIEVRGYLTKNSVAVPVMSFNELFDLFISKIDENKLKSK